MYEPDHARDIGALTEAVSQIERRLTAIEADAVVRAQKQSADHRAIMEKLEALKEVSQRQQGFISGALFTVRAFWVAVGVAISGAAAFITTYGIPPGK